jgi:hypothetical protein
VNFFHFFVVSLPHDPSGNLGDRFQAGPSDPTQALKPKKFSPLLQPSKKPAFCGFLPLGVFFGAKSA